MALQYKDIFLRPEKCIVNSRSECNISAKLGGYTFASPVAISNMKSIQTVDICRKFDKKNWFYIYQRIDGVENTLNFVRLANKESWRVISISVGIKDSDIRLIEKLKVENLRVNFITIDVALSYTDRIIPVINCIRKNFPEVFLIVGNGCTKEWIKFLEEQKVDCAKINIGTSTSCRTRQFSGFGCSPISALQECAEASKKITLLSDGGLTVEDGEVWIGDVAKAIRFGADFVLSGSLFSRCLDSPSILNGYYGNASRVAKGNNHVEGAKVNVETNGLTIEQQMDLISDSLKSSVSYAGGKDLSVLKNVKFDILNHEI
jgi:GMP reductase